MLCWDWYKNPGFSCGIGPDSSPVSGLTPAANGALVPFLCVSIYFTREIISAGVHNDTILLNILDTSYVFDRPIRILVALPRVITTIALNSKI